MHGRTHGQRSRERLLEPFSTRKLRHDIVHRALRLTLKDRGRAQRAVETSRWLHNKIESKPERERLREFGGLTRSRATVYRVLADQNYQAD
jgi:hypothetical protein